MEWKIEGSPNEQGGEKPKVGRQLMEKTLEQENCREKVEEIVASFPEKKGALIPALQAIQEEFGYLPRPALEVLAKSLRVPFSTVYGVATFYAQFHLEPRGKHIVRVCMGTACHVRGGKKLLETLERELGVEAGGTTEDLNFTLEEVACIGACGLAPAVMVDDETFGRLTPDKLTEVLDQYRQ